MVSVLPVAAIPLGPAPLPLTPPFFFPERPEPFDPEAPCAPLAPLAPDMRDPAPVVLVVGLALSAEPSRLRVASATPPRTSRATAEATRITRGLRSRSERPGADGVPSGAP
ncbi:unannotated protein [freshwater metagenome]|uniref:Unannotated protein n=1 Tax=freshwater metagenome TaxID=449393 RepID=A0A6J7P6J7_9ZZZZ